VPPGGLLVTTPTTADGSGWWNHKKIGEIKKGKIPTFTTLLKSRIVNLIIEGMKFV
jgi:hypothetical protein